MICSSEAVRSNQRRGNPGMTSYSLHQKKTPTVQLPTYYIHFFLLLPRFERSTSYPALTVQDTKRSTSHSINRPTMESDLSVIMLIIVTIFMHPTVPPLGVFLLSGFTTDLLINIILTILGCLFLYSAAKDLPGSPGTSRATSTPSTSNTSTSIGESLAHRVIWAASPRRASTRRRSRVVAMAFPHPGMGRCSKNLKENEQTDSRLTEGVHLEPTPMLVSAELSACCLAMIVFYEAVTVWVVYNVWRFMDKGDTLRSWEAEEMMMN
ncbi:hypothetical protein T310_9852 [Rasamsonia emersonii CBS 393.64]|uniref:Uncharacterized protein n=1 Tax=Rasamsonia emersonii (strain ATCC 16479 / CBS 393.64 / IMI 116815) TaxID=1408163 RepID=A0A0F4YEJ7_RASE3|nr:hypothetical protein T310_9852 [Rasamsonia emersonii CBS 393.64]KKA16585.1 hypothetical protein T310_9852 [Rasamsonia emersonii CBS 393.64]